MKVTLLVLVAALQFPIPAARAAFYQWTDAHAVVHFTDDPGTIPGRYKKRARRLDLPDQQAPDRVPLPAPGASPPLASPPLAPPPAPAYGGRSEQAWRESFTALRGELKELQEGLPAKKARLAELRRRRSIYFRAQDREAVNLIQAEISADEARLSELQNSLDSLSQEADRALVPAGWRR